MRNALFPVEVFFILFLISFHDSDALPLPSTFKVDRNGKPRLATLVGKVIGVGTRVGLCARSVQELSVNVEAESNRAVVRGDLKEVAIHVKQSRGPFLKLSGVDIQGSHLRLGWWPAFFTSLPFVLWKLRPSLFPMIFYFGLYKLYSASQQYSNSQSSKRPTPLASLRKKLDGYPCHLYYSVVLSEEDVNKSKLIQIGLNSVLRHLMLNSVLKEAAATADAFSMLNQQANQQSIQHNNKQPSNLLKPTDSLSDGKGELWQDTSSPKPVVKQERMLTKLLQATAFELTNVTFDSGRMFWDADAIFPESDGQTRLSYVLRTTLDAMVLHQDHTLGFANPECQFSLGATMGGPLGRFLPDVWLPVGPGVALSLGSNHRIRRVGIFAGECQIDGRISFFQKENTGLAQRVRNNLQLPFNGKGKNPRKSLNPSKDVDDR